MIFGKKRFVIPIIGIALASGALVILGRILRLDQIHAIAPFVSGWLLTSFLLFLAMYNLRKKISFVPIGRVYVWAQLHLYVGLFAAGLFYLHLSSLTPTGPLESIIWLVMVAILITGGFGVIFSKIAANRLALKPHEEIFERIPSRIALLKRDSEQEVVAIVEHAHSTTVATFYEQALAPLYRGPSHFWAHLFHSQRPYSYLQREVNEVRRYLNDDEREALGRIATRAFEKIDLDFHYAHQLTLRGWLMIHLPATYALFALIVLHAALAHRFFAG
jgi:hypothetical protein